MNENEALASLLDAMDGVEQEAGKEAQEAQEKQIEATPAQEAQQAPQAMQNEELSKEGIISAVLEAIKQNDQDKLSQMTSSPDAKAQLLELLGLSGINEQLNGLISANEEAKEQARLQSVFNRNVEQFEQDFPTIKPAKLKEFADENGLGQLLGEDYAGWQAVAKMMLKVATPQGKADEIFSSSSGGLGADDAFKRSARGEDVSDVAFGNALLKSIGGA